MPLIAPSLLSADFLNLEKEIKMINSSDADWFHLDIMDGVFVPNLTFGFPIIEKIAAKASKPLDVHLMIVDPDRYVERFAKSGANYISVHLEACTHLHRTIEAIHKAGAKAGVALNPHTPVCLLQDIISELDLVLIMSVNPGFGGQQFIEHTYTKIGELKNMIHKEKSSALIEIDGGIGLLNAGSLVKSGADVLVAGYSVFSADVPVEMINRLKSVK